MNIYSNGDLFKLRNPNTINVEKQYIVYKIQHTTFKIL